MGKVAHRPYSPETMTRLIDSFQRPIDYLRVSVTDRCDFRCVYCMSEHMTFLPKAEVLTLEELDRIASAFISLGVRKLRLTGGEPLVRKGVMGLVEGLGRHLRSGDLQELTLTTNGTQLAQHAPQLADAGVKRINVSLDTLKPDLFRTLTRGGDVARVIAGIDAAQAAGLKVKINAVALKDDNAAELPDLIRWAHGRGCDMTLIETMPMGEVEADRTDQYLSLTAFRRVVVQRVQVISDPFAQVPGRRHIVHGRCASGGASANQAPPDSTPSVGPSGVCRSSPISTSS